jgi:hypothetical protein
MDIEAGAIHEVLFGCQKVEKQSTDAAVSQLVCHEPISRAESAAAAAMREQNDFGAALRQVEIPLQNNGPGRNEDFILHSVIPV